MIISKRVRIEPDVITKIVRTLPGKGKINVSVGQEVTPEEVIGTATVASGFRIMNIASQLGVAPSSIEGYLQKKAGQIIYRGELLALKKGGFLKGEKIITAPTDGLIDFINPVSGEVKLNFLPKKIDLPAAVFGIVEFVDHGHGKVLIKTRLSKLYGVFGTGRSREGLLHVAQIGRDLIDSASVSSKDAEHILVVKGLVYKDAISAAISCGVSGVITGGINSADYKGMAGSRISFPKRFDNDIGISIIATEGFGSVPVGADFIDMLNRFDQKFVFIDGNQSVISLPEFKSDCMLKIRRTHLPPTLGVELHQVQSEPFEGDLSIGMKVRVIGVTFLGEQGKIVQIDKLQTKLPSGIVRQLATIETRSRKIQVPVTNLEII